MIRGVWYELKLIGRSLWMMCALLLAGLLFVALFGGDLLHLSSIGFEVIFPLFTAMAVGEWGKTRADDNFEIIAAQGRSLFWWVVTRFLAVWAAAGLSAAGGMAAVCLIREEMPFWESLLIYAPVAFCLSSLSAFVGCCIPQEHAASCVCGVVWLAELLLRGLLRVPGVEYFYLFIRYAGDQNGIWPVNKAVLMVVGIVCWGSIYRICKSPCCKIF